VKKDTLPHLQKCTAFLTSLLLCRKAGRDATTGSKELEMLVYPEKRKRNVTYEIVVLSCSRDPGNGENLFMSLDPRSEHSTSENEKREEVFDVELLPQVDRAEREEVQKRSSISPMVVHESIRVEGERELQRGASALTCSALAAGLSMGFSLVGRGELHYYLPPAAWRPLVESFGYSLGFLIVVLGRQQLFTENTLTVILPLLAHFNVSTFARVVRLWGIVLVGNLAGAFLFAALIAHTLIFPPGIRAVFLTISQEALAGGFGLLVLRGILAGWLIALMVWLLPAAASARFHTIVILTYIIGVAAFAHIIVDAVSSFYLVNLGKISILAALGYLFPILIGNIIGGTVLVAVLNYGQIVKNMGASGAQE
jgi:formate/nitrite transporter FocA (FNT family)